MNLAGLQLPKDDPRTYVVAWIALTLLIVLISKWSPSLAVGLALTALFGIAITMTEGKLV